MVTRWSPVAISQLQKAYRYIKKDSLQNAEKVRNEIVAVTISPGQCAERFPPDKYKQNNYGSYRAFELHRYRISYKIMKDEILIVRLRHPSMSPLTY
jgi:plasmid stabilization system protein ParE